MSRLQDELVALVAVIRTAFRVRGLLSNRSFDQAVGELRSAHSEPCPQPLVAARVTSKLLPLLPPWGAGRCVKRSLILLHLWSGAGLRVELRMGILKRKSKTREGHVWLSVEPPDLAPFCGAQIGSDEEIFEF